MKHICLNLKRFDVPPALGGVNRLSEISTWASAVMGGTQQGLRAYDPKEVRFSMYFPEAHLLSALEAREQDSPVHVGCQGVFRGDVAPGGNFGAFTTNRPAAAMRAMGVTDTLIGHCEERRDKLGILAAAGVTGAKAAHAVNHLLNEEVRCAVQQGMPVVYCIGEESHEQDRWEEVLGAQLRQGLEGVDTAQVVIAYEPIWSIGPGKTPADKPYITKVARFVKEQTGGLPVIYGGGLKTDNAAMLASIAEIDGGLIALTRFQGEIGFYPEEYLEIIRIYMEHVRNGGGAGDAASV